MKRYFIILAVCCFVLGGSLLLKSCKRQDLVPPPTSFNFVIPPGFPATTFSFSSNPLTEEGIRLGRKLFYEGRLSADGNFPCASCHEPCAAFTTFEHDRSHGFNNSHTLRNAPGLFNLAWYPYFNQDGSAGSLSQVILNHLQRGDEMATTMPDVINRLKDDNGYKNLFRAAFGDASVTEDRIYKALSQFLVSMVSANSKYDRVLQGLEAFHPTEAAGYTVFQNKCGSCHTEPLFTDFSFRNTGLPLDPALNDGGRIRVTRDAADTLKFRVPSLRNLELTSYYGHDGRFSIPRHMIRHYRNGVQPGANVDLLVAGGISMTDTEENHLVLFLRTLTDSSFLNNPRFRE